MAYRGDEGDALEAPTSEGPLRLEVGPRLVRLSVGHRTLQLAGKYATVVADTRKKKAISYELRGHVFVARGVPREDVGVWIEVPGGAERDPKAPMVAARRIFGVAPVNLLDPDGLRALKRLDALAARLRTAVGALEHVEDGFSGRAVEIGSGQDLDKVLLADYGDHYAVYARRLFRDRARLQMAIHKDGKIVLGDAEPFTITSRFGITVRGDYVRFADAQGTDLARVAIPWIAAEDRDELARRIGQLVDRA